VVENTETIYIISQKNGVEY